MRLVAPLLVLCLAPAVARAQITSEPVAPHPDPTKFARGLYGEAELGALVFLGEAGGMLGPGAAVGARLGADMFRWIAVQVHALGSTHLTGLAGTPQAGQLLQLYQGTAELKLTVSFGQFAVSAMGGGGLARLSTNLLGTTGLTAPDIRNTLVFLGGLGANYHTLSRHFSFGLSAMFARYQKISTTGALAGTAYVRYTF